MNITSIRPYWANCFLLTLPVLIWNLILTTKLPPAYQPNVFGHSIPPWITYGETTFRSIVFLLALLMPLGLATDTQKKGLFLYTIGLLAYFASWVPLIYFPASSWSQSWPGFMAPAYTPFVWLTGIGFIGHSFSINLRFHRWYFLLMALLFILFHTLHTYLIYSRVHGSTLQSLYSTNWLIY